MNKTRGPVASRISFILAACASWTCLFSPVMGQSVINRSGSSADKIGILEPINNIEVATSEVGIVREMYVKLGDFVEIGTPLGRLDQEQQIVQLREAELDAAAGGTMETARREVEFNTRRVDETSKMVTSGKGSPRELERYQLELNIALAKLRSQEEAKEISKARLDKAKLMFRERTVLSPLSGTVVDIYREVGEYIAGNAPMLIRLIDTTKLRARFLLSNDAAERFRKMEFVDVRLANHRVVQAKIEFIAPFENAEGHVIEMTVLIENADGMIRTSSCELILP
jgi:RND family efflux transporter MFP subunit